MQITFVYIYVVLLFPYLLHRYTILANILPLHSIQYLTDIFPSFFILYPNIRQYLSGNLIPSSIPTPHCYTIPSRHPSPILNPKTITYHSTFLYPTGISYL